MDFNEKNNENTDNKNVEITDIDNIEQKNDHTKYVNIAILAAISVVVIFIGFLIVSRTCIVSHNWVAATCEKPRTCVRCGETDGNALGHKWKEATCTEPKTCSVCGKIDGEPLGHTVSEWKTDKAATCTEAGIQSGICSVCNETVKENIPAPGHTLGQWEIGTAATIELSGEKIQKCTSCGEIINRDRYYLTEEEKQALKKAEEERIKAEKAAEVAREKAEKEAAEKARQENLARQFSISNTSAERSSSDYVRVYYKLTNNSSGDASMIKLKCTLYNSSGKALTSNNMYVYDLPEGQFKENMFILTCSEPFSNYKITIENVSN